MKTVNLFQDGTVVLGEELGKRIERRVWRQSLHFGPVRNTIYGVKINDNR